LDDFRTEAIRVQGHVHDLIVPHAGEPTGVEHERIDGRAIGRRRRLELGQTEGGILIPTAFGGRGTIAAPNFGP
jgi:hypothetical protein